VLDAGMIAAPLKAIPPGRRLVLCAAPTGAVLGCLAWAFLGGTPAAAERLQADRGRLAAGRPAMARLSPVADLAAIAGGHPLFILTTGPGAVADVAVRLDGLSRSSGRAAALLSIDGAPAQWVERGGSLAGVTLTAVLDSEVVLETPLGQKEARLGEGPPAAAPGAGMPGPNMLPGAAGRIPPGVRLPPQPASAPHP
jgi:hypothetical protein